MKFLASLNIILVLVTLVVVLSGETKEATSLLGNPSIESPVRLLRSSPVGIAESSNDNVYLSTAVQEAEFAAAGGTPLTQQGMLSTLTQDDPEFKAGQPVAAGGMSVKVTGAGTSAVFCVHAHLSQAFQCADVIVTAPHRSAVGDGNTLAAAQQQAQQSVRTPASGSSATGVQPGAVPSLKQARALARGAGG